MPIISILSIILLSASLWHLTLWVVERKTLKLKCFIKTIAGLSSVLTLLFSLILTLTIIILSTETYAGFFTIKDTEIIKIDKVLSRIVFALNLVTQIMTACRNNSQIEIRK